MKLVLVAPDGGIYRDSDGNPIQADDEAILKARAYFYNLSDWRIVSADLPWKVIEDLERGAVDGCGVGEPDHQG